MAEVPIHGKPESEIERAILKLRRGRWLHNPAKLD
jgi:hypothetical protein